MSNFPHMTSQDFNLDGNKYRYWAEGDSKNPPIVILYGFTGVAKDFLEVSAQLKSKYFIIIPEFPGWNGSPRLSEDLTIHNYAKFFKRLLDSQGIKKINLLGHCVGAVAAIEFSYLYPEMIESLILVSTPYLGGSKSEKFHKFLVGLAERSPRRIRPVYFFWRSRLLSVPVDFFAIKLDSFEKKLDRIKEHIFKQPNEPEDAVEENWISFIRFDFSKVKDIKFPVHLIHGAQDLLVSVNQAVKLKKLFRNATFDVISSAGHVPPVESTKDLVHLIRKYLKS